MTKSGLTSLGISGMITTGRLNVCELDETVIIMLAIVEGIGYVYGVIALLVGRTQTHLDKGSEAHMEKKE